MKLGVQKAAGLLPLLLTHCVHVITKLVSTDSGTLRLSGQVKLSITIHYGWAGKDSFILGFTLSGSASSIQNQTNLKRSNNTPKLESNMSCSRNGMKEGIREERIVHEE